MVATGKITSFLNAMRDKFLASTTLLEWIQAVGGAGYSTTGRVILGRRPQTNPDVQNGTIVYIRRGALRAHNAGAEKTVLHELEVIADMVWYEDRTASNTGATQMNYVDELIDEFEDVGNALASGFGGQFLGITCDDLDDWDEENPNIHHLELVFSIWY